MATYYVSKSGSNGAATSLATAKTTIAAGIALVSGGDTLLIDDGVYVESLRNVIPAGSSGAPTIIQAIHSNAVTLRPTGGTDVFTLNADWITIDGIDADAVNCTGSPYQAYNGGFGVNHVTIKNGTARNGNGNPSSSSGIMGNYIDGLIQNMSVHNNTTGTNQDHGIYTAGPRCIVELCVMYENGGYGLVIYPSATDCIVRRCIIRDNVLRGIIIDGTTNRFYNNLVYSNAQSIEVRGTSNAVVGNTVYSNGSGTYGIWISSGNGNKVQNNIVYGNSDDTIQNDGTSSTVDHNSSTDPTFLDVATSNFHQASTSNTIGAGIDLSSYYTTDFDGTLRTLPFDIGAYEYLGIPPASGSNRRLIASDTFDGGSQVVLGGNWQQLNTAASTVYETAAGRVGGSPANSTDVGAVRWTADAFTNDHYASLEFKQATSTADGSSFIGVCGRASGDINGAHDMYYVIVVNVAGVVKTILASIVNGSITILVRRDDITWTAGDRVEIECEGTTIRALRSGTVLFSATDSNLMGGAPGIVATGTLDSLGDNFEAGNLNDTTTSIPAQKGRRFVFLKLRG